MQRYSLVPAVAVSLMLILPLGATAQISITSSDILKPEGYTIGAESAGGPLTVDNGSPGGPRTWDFTSYVMSYFAESEVVNVAGTPFASDFPGANMCIFFASEDRQGGTYEYMSVTSSLWTILGFGFEFPETSFVQKYNPAGQIPLPIDMNDSWTFTIGWSDTTPFYTITGISRSRQHVDAYGTMTIPMGTFNVLRGISFDTTITTTEVPPYYEVTDTTTSISYLWLGKDPVLVAEVSSMDGETDPEFTEAGYIERAASPVGIDDEETEGKIPRGFSLEQNYPNPFNPETEITFSVKEASADPVELSIFSLRGARVATLVSGTLEPGTHSVIWNGKNEKGEALPSGVYFYRLTAAGQSITRKMLLAR